MTATGAAAPPPDTSDLTLTPPVAVAAVAPAQADDLVKLDPAALPALDGKVSTYVDALLATDPHSPAFETKLADIRSMGDRDIRAAADASNRLLDSPLRAMHDGPMSERGGVATTLLDLRTTIEDLDPKNATAARKLLGVLPRRAKLTDYFRRYESAQAHLDAIVTALYDGQDELRKDNAALEQEKVRLWETMQRLQQYIYVAEHLDSALDAKITAFDAADPERAKTLRNDVLFTVRQKHQDLLTQMAVSAQGYFAIDLVRRNNTELIRGVDRATTTTIAALRTAVVVAQALTNQRLVLGQITALNTTTSNLIESTSRVIAEQTTDTNEQAATATVSLDALRAAFANLYRSIDAIDTFKGQALDAMSTTVTSLQSEIAKSQAYLDRVRASGPAAT
jgi:uncharacterized protein YaaN involved in tellurite resistance